MVPILRDGDYRWNKYHKVKEEDIVLRIHLFSWVSIFKDWDQLAFSWIFDFVVVQSLHTKPIINVPTKPTKIGIQRTKMNPQYTKTPKITHFCRHVSITCHCIIIKDLKLFLRVRLVTPKDSWSFDKWKRIQKFIIYNLKRQKLIFICHHADFVPRHLSSCVHFHLILLLPYDLFLVNVKEVRKI